MNNSERLMKEPPMLEDIVVMICVTVGVLFIFGLILLGTMAAF